MNQKLSYSKCCSLMIKTKITEREIKSLEQFMYSLLYHNFSQVYTCLRYFLMAKTQYPTPTILRTEDLFWLTFFRFFSSYLFDPKARWQDRAVWQTRNSVAPTKQGEIKQRDGEILYVTSHTHVVHLLQPDFISQHHI